MRVGDYCLKYLRSTQIVEIVTPHLILIPFIAILAAHKMGNKKKKKPRTELREPRNLLAVDAHFRKAGAMKDRRLKRDKEEREYLEDIEDNDTQDN